MSFARAFFIVAALALVSACTASVTESSDAKTETVTTKDGTVTVGKVDARALGAPVYPGADQGDGSVATTTGDGSNQMAAFKTVDSFDRVYAYYKAHMPPGSEKMKLEQSGSSVASFVVGDNSTTDQTSVMITGKTNETQIIIAHGKKP